MVKNKVSKTTKGFDDSLTLWNIFGFISLILLYWFSIDVGAWATSILMLLTGSALLLEGQITSAKVWMRDGIQGHEVPLLLTLLVGLVVMITGILKLPFIHYVNPVIDGYIAFISLFAVGFIVIQRWFYK